jgi:hypothetical protein
MAEASTSGASTLFVGINALTVLQRFQLKRSWRRSSWRCARTTRVHEPNIKSDAPNEHLAFRNKHSLRRQYEIYQRVFRSVLISTRHRNCRWPG